MTIQSSQLRESAALLGMQNPSFSEETRVL